MPTHQCHHFPHCPFDVENIGALNTNHSILAAHLREQNIGTIHFHDLADLVQPAKQNVVDLGVRNGNIFAESFGRVDKIGQPHFGISDLVLAPSSDDDLIIWPSNGILRAVSVYLRKWRWEVYCRVRRGFDIRNVLACSAADETMERQVDFDRVYIELALVRCQLSLHRETQAIITI